MDNATLNNITESCRKELSVLAIGSGLNQLKTIARYCSDNQIISQVEEIMENYHSMLSFLANGGKDEERSQTQEKISQKALAVLMAAHRNIRLQEDNQKYSKSYHELQNLYGTEPEQELLKKWGSNLEPDEQMLIQDHLFLLIWTSPLWTQKQTAQWYEFLCRQTDNIQTHLVGAVILSLWEYFDVEKLSLLFFFTENENEKLNALSVTALIFLAEKYKFELTHYPDLCKRYQEKPIKSHFFEVLTEKMIMHQTLLALKEEESMITSFSLSMSQEDMSQLMEKKMNHLQKMIADGLDVNLGNRMSLWNRSDFLRDNISHWWIPFEITSPAIQDLLIDKDGNFKADSYKMLDVPNECDIDRYAMYSYVAKSSLKNSFLDIMAKGFQEIEQATDGEIYIQINHYKITMQNLYRIFTYSPIKNQIDNPFSWKYCFWENPVYQIQFSEKEYHRLIQAMISSEFYNDAAQWIDSIGQKEGYDYYMLEKKTDCQIKLEQYAQAIDLLTQILFLEPNDKEALQKMQQCYKHLGKHEKELQFTMKLLEMYPDEIQYTDNAAFTLMKLKRYEEALPYFFKLDYLKSGNPRYMQGIEKCAFHLKKFDVALRYCLAILEVPNVKYKEVEYKNAGHIYLVQGDWNKALEYYKKFYTEFQRLYKDEDAINIETLFFDDEEELKEMGISASDYHLMYDMIMLQIMPSQD